MRRITSWGLPGLLFFLLMTTVWAIPPFQERSPENLFQQALDNMRNDVELLADFVYGGGERPETWLGTTDFTSESMLADLFLDIEQSADALYGAGLRPSDWIGATSRNADLVTRNLRHDLERAATDFFSGNLDVGQPGVEVDPEADLRPDEWIGDVRLTRCTRTVMNIVLLLTEAFGVRPTTPEEVRVYCPTLEGEIEDVLVDQALGLEADVIADTTPSLILAVRGDLERLADEVLGLNNRPPGWLDNTNVESVTLASDILTDMERLADIVLGVGIRPRAWIGATRSSAIATFRNLRHDLELLGDIALGEGVRPNNWQGESEIFRCEPQLQTLVFLAERAYGYDLPNLDVTGREYCRAVYLSANGIAENPPQPDEDTELAEDDIQFTAEANYAFSYLDAAATDYMGAMPAGTLFRAWYRNFGGSTMMFVSGEDFAVFIDRRWTTLDEDIYRRLPTLEGIRPLTFCDARWCNGPGPTPTPTGSGPLLEIIQQNTPPAALVPVVTPGVVDEQTLVSWNNIRVNYLLQRPDATCVASQAVVGCVQVSLEICRDPSQVVCEPIVSVLDSTTGVSLSVVSQFNGLNVYEMPYGYSTNFTLQGSNFYSEDIWLNDPSLTGQ
ncbi:MAG: hypothetical protein Q9P01_09330 [Anaerolineae bacterium]|nr:hypothetical protein [Anaerolineae bacterium]MDQ7035018.1 hypothetical protein [Anaerolineae bacterium]